MATKAEGSAFKGTEAIVATTTLLNSSPYQYPSSIELSAMNDEQHNTNNTDKMGSFNFDACSQPPEWSAFVSNLETNNKVSKFFEMKSKFDYDKNPFTEPSSSALSVAMREAAYPRITTPRKVAFWQKNNRYSEIDSAAVNSQTSAFCPTTFSQSFDSPPVGEKSMPLRSNSSSCEQNVDLLKSHVDLKLKLTDSEGAKLVGDTDEQLITKTQPNYDKHISKTYLEKSDSCSCFCFGKDDCTNDDDTDEQRAKSKHFSSLEEIRFNYVQHTNSNRIQTPKPKTPTLKKTRQKAISLDSSDAKLSFLTSQQLRNHYRERIDVEALNSSHLPEKYVSTLTISIPGTPKHSLSRVKQLSDLSFIPLKPPISSFTQNINSNSQSVDGKDRSMLKLDSFERNLGSEELIDVNAADIVLSTIPSTSSAIKKLSPDYLIGTNLKAQKGANALSLSNSNLKTLPEIMPLSDFSVSRKQVNEDKLSSLDVLTDGGGCGGGGGGPFGKTNSSRSTTRSSLLQRRGSNHSLTLNLNESYSLNRGLSDSNNSRSKKGLLERRGSNASLTINLQHNTLGVSNLRGSACSLSSINTHYLEEEYELRDEHNHHHHQEENEEFLDTTHLVAVDNNTMSVGQQRKFFSSENLNNFNNRSQYSKLNQTHVRNSTKTCFGSVSDLITHNQLKVMNLSTTQDEICQLQKRIPKTSTHTATATAATSSPTIALLKKSKQKQSIPENFITSFQQSNICSCTGLRNITTRPLSPQTTSKDFKMYLANIQLLQNASNVLNGSDLMKLNYVFEKRYNDADCDQNQDSSRFDERQVLLSSLDDISMPNEYEEKRLLKNLYQELWDLPTNHQEKPMVFGSQSKNRYETILPNEHSRVQLIAEEGSTETPYINANYIKGPDFVRKCYIATQGPLPNTIYDFWLMIYQNILKYDQKSSSKKSNQTPTALPPELDTFEQSSTSSPYYRQQKIIMLTDFIENNEQKCATYFPINKNDIFLITSRNEEINNNDINTFYNGYFNKCETSSPIETFEIEINDKNLVRLLPKINYFIIKNDGIIMKNGFSIRQLHCLFCCDIKSKHKLKGNNNNSDQINSKNIKIKINYDDENDVNNKRIQIVQSFRSFHYWNPDWPDHRSPNDISVLLDISQHVLAFENTYDQPFPIIHCSAGIGRSGCMAAILNAICQIRTSLSLKSIKSYQESIQSTEAATTAAPAASTETTTMVHNHLQTSTTSCEDNVQSFSSQPVPCSNNICISNKNTTDKNPSSNEQIIQDNNTKHNLKQTPKPQDDESSRFATIANQNIQVDILGIVCNLRLQRGGMVQNSEQYELIHRVVCLYLKRVLKLIHEETV